MNATFSVSQASRSRNDGGNATRPGFSGALFRAALLLLLAAGCAGLPGSARRRSADPAPADKVVSRVLVQDGRSWDGKPLPAYPEAPPQISVLHIVIPPGVTLPWHRHPVINAGMLISGELTVITEHDERLHLKAGDALIEVVGTWHYGRNEGSEPAEIVVFYAGAEGLPLSEPRPER